MLYKDYIKLKSQLEAIPHRANSENQNAINSGKVTEVIYRSNFLSKVQKDKLQIAKGDVNPSGYYYNHSGSANVIAFLDNVVAGFYKGKEVA